MDIDLLLREKGSLLTSQATMEREDQRIAGRAILDELKERTQTACTKRKITASPSDAVGTFLVLYKALTQRNRGQANEYLFGKSDPVLFENVITRARKQTAEDLAMLTRLIILYDEEAKDSITSYHRFARELAQRAGVNVRSIDADIARNAEQRTKRNAVRIREIDKIVKANYPVQKRPEAVTKPKAPVPPKGVRKATQKHAGATTKKTIRHGKHRKVA